MSTFLWRLIACALCVFMSTDDFYHMNRHLLCIFAVIGCNLKRFASVLQKRKKILSALQTDTRERKYENTNVDYYRVRWFALYVFLFFIHFSLFLFFLFGYENLFLSLPNTHHHEMHDITSIGRTLTISNLRNHSLYFQHVFILN